MTMDLTALPGLLVLALELCVLAGVGFVVARVVLRQGDDLMALAQGMVIGPALWGLVVNFAMRAVPGGAGTLVGWVVMVTVGGWLAWRAPAVRRTSPRGVAGFVVVALGLLWVVLASRQMLSIVDAYLHLGLAASMQAGEFPPAFPWHPGLPAPYHYGADMLIGLLAPPFGPDLAFTTELFEAYAWTSLALVVGTLVLRRGSWIALLAGGPLLLSFGLWTQLHNMAPPGILQVPVPAGIPEAGLRASLAEIYWPSSRFPWTSAVDASPPNIWKPHFVLAYALALVVLERAAASRESRMFDRAALALLIGFLGLVEEIVAPIALGLWVVLEALRLLDGWRGGHAPCRRSILRAAAGPVLGVLLLVFGGGPITDALIGSSRSGLSVGWIADAGSRRPLGAVTGMPGGVGVLELGVVAVAAVAVLLAWRNRLAVALAVASGVLLLAALTLRYEYSLDVVRLDGHARNFALLALLVALGHRLSALRPRWRYAAAATTVALVTWPTAAAPVHNLGLALTRGPHISNAALDPNVGWRLTSRYAIPRPMSEDVAAYIREHTAADARVLTPTPSEMTIVTGRPNASAYAEFVQFVPRFGPEYLDAIRFLEPSAVRRLGVTYIHAPDDWVAGLPDQARHWLHDPDLFELLIREGADALFRVRPAFLRLEAAPPPESFEALRRAVPAATTVYLSPALEPGNSIRAAVVLSHARLLGEARPTPTWHSRPDIATEPLGNRTPDLIVMSARLAPSSFPPTRREPIWWNDEIAVYAPSGAVATVMDPPSPSFSVRVSDARMDAERLAFTATFADRAPDLWRGQDWLVVPVDHSSWAFPGEFEADGRTHAGVQWYAGQVIPGQGMETRTFGLNPSAASLVVVDDNGTLAAVASSGEGLTHGVWTLAVRLRGDWWEAALIPVVHIAVSDRGEVAYQVYEGSLGVRPIP